jgi:hypothetical protein
MVVILRSYRQLSGIENEYEYNDLEVIPTHWRYFVFVDANTEVYHLKY